MKIPFPAWDLLPMERYLPFPPAGSGTTERSPSYVTGVPLGCTFCSSTPSQDETGGPARPKMY